VITSQFPSTSGTRSLATPPWPMPFWTVWSTMPTAWNSKGILAEEQNRTYGPEIKLPRLSRAYLGKARRVRDA